jgi:RNA polymerase sigma factor (sigma-70 family)
MDEPTLLAALADDLDLAFETLVRSRQDRVFSIALRILGDPSDAEDVAQDALVRAYRALGAWPAARIRELRLDAWLATIVVNTARSRIRRRSRTAARESLTFLDELDHPRSAPAERLWPAGPDRGDRGVASGSSPPRALPSADRTAPRRRPRLRRIAEALGRPEARSRRRSIAGSASCGRCSKPGIEPTRPLLSTASRRPLERPNHQPPAGDAAPDALPPPAQEVTR